MFIDFLFCILMIMAVFKGYSRGFIVAIFSLIAFFVGLIAAVKLSAAVAVWLENKTSTQTTWMPFIAFVVVMAAVMLIIKFGAAFIEKVVQFMLFGWLNKLGGILFYMIIYILFFSIVLFYAENMGLLDDETMKTSRVYSYIAPMGPQAVNVIGSVLPLFRGLFEQLESFFDGAGNKIN